MQEINHAKPTTISLNHLRGKRSAIAPLNHDNASPVSASQSHGSLIRREMDAFKSNSFEQNMSSIPTYQLDQMLPDNNGSDICHHDQSYQLRNDPIFKRRTRQSPSSKTEGNDLCLAIPSSGLLKIHLLSFLSSDVTYSFFALV